MPIALWSQDYWTGHADIDRQHQTLFALINTLHEAMIEGHGDQVVYQTLQALATYTIDHFATEENLMLTKAYPDYDRHHVQHERLKRKVQNLLLRLNRDQVTTTIEVSQFLADWLIHHIKGEDQKLFQYLRQKN